MKLSGLRKLLTYHLVKVGLRTVEHPIEGRSAKRIRKSVPLGNGLGSGLLVTLLEQKLTTTYVSY
jgi:hypothetical protein